MGSCISVVEEILQQSQAGSGPSSSTNSATAGTGTQSQAGPSAVHDKLPPGAEKHRVRNVYDGDTLTLTDERRVRLLGIDTPEIKEKQAYSIEAKEYTRSRCHKKEVYLSFERNGEKKDHYGRLLAFVWVRNPDDEGGGQFLCVNEGIVAAGLANVYAPNASSRVHNWEKMIALQSQARLQEVGMWSTFEDFYVVKTTNGAAYHNRDCRHLAKSKHLTDLKVSEALDKGLHPCRTCLADA